jgi:hypothetical protein
MEWQYDNTPPADYALLSGFLRRADLNASARGSTEVTMGVNGDEFTALMGPNRISHAAVVAVSTADPLLRRILGWARWPVN